MLSGFQTGTQELLVWREIFQVQHCPTAALFYQPISSEETGLQGSTKADKVLLRAHFQDPTLPLSFLSGLLSISSMQQDNTSLLTESTFKI